LETWGSSAAAMVVKTAEVISTAQNNPADMDLERIDF
jgi:hypothetical protein